MRPRRHRALLCGPSTSPLERMLTAFDRLWWLVFIVVTLVLMAVGSCVPILYLIPPEELPAPGHNFSFGQAALCFLGMALGYAASLALFGFLSRRFASAETHQRWAEVLYDESNSYVRYRAPGLAKSIRWALIPREHRDAFAGSMRSNNRWRGP